MDNGTWSREGRRALQLDSSDVLSIVEAAYDIDSPQDTWALELLRAIDRAVGGGFGAFACVSHGLGKDTFNIDRTSVVSLGSDDETMLTVFEQHANGRSAGWSHDYRDRRGAARCLLTSEMAAGRQPLAFPELVADRGHDGVNILARDVNDEGFLMSLAVPANIDVTSATRRDLTRAATHVLAAIRLRARLAAGKPAAKRENRSHPPSGGPSSLTETERSAVTAAACGQTTKEIAYALGVADATVRVLLMRAARRCGVKSRKELLNLWSRTDGGGT